MPVGTAFYQLDQYYSRGYPQELVEGPVFTHIGVSGYYLCVTSKVGLHLTPLQFRSRGSAGMTPLPHS